MDSPQQAPWWWRRSPVRDAIYAGLMTVLTVFGAYGEAHPRQISDKMPATSAAAHTPTAALLLVAAASLVLAWRNRWPRLVLTVSAGAVAVYSLLGYVNGAALLAPVVAVYTLATKETPRRAIAWSAAVLVVLMAATAAHNPFGPTGAGFYLIPGLIAAGCLGGIAIASRRAYVASIEERAGQEAQRRVDEERLRIARDLHDVVAHTMATINVQAGAAAHVATERPEVGQQALLTIKAASKDGLRELRAILNVLRRADETDPTQPTPGIAQLEALIERARQAGLDTTLSVAGPRRALSAAVELTAYRIVQESLTNTIRHAGPASAAVSLTYLNAELLVEVTDTGLGHAAWTGSGAGMAGPRDAESAERPPGTGHGLAGMRERAVSVGGTIEAGPLSANGFRVVARLPAPGASEPGETTVTQEPRVSGGADVTDEADGVEGTEVADGADVTDEADGMGGAEVAGGTGGTGRTDTGEEAGVAEGERAGYQPARGAS
jgi:signal transduction histidine kinase